MGKPRHRLVSGATVVWSIYAEKDEVTFPKSLISVGIKHLNYFKKMGLNPPGSQDLGMQWGTALELVG